MLTWLKIQGYFNGFVHIIQVLMFGMHLFTRAMNWGKNHPCLHSSKGWKLSLGPHPRSYTCEHIFWSTGTLVLSTLSSHCSMRAGQFWSHCSQKAIRRWDSIVSGSSSSGVTERQKYSSRIQGPCSVYHPYQSWQTYWQHDGWHPTTDLGGLASVTSVSE